MFNHMIPWQLPGVPFDHLILLPEISAVYFALGQDDNVLYIGQTVNLSQRWKGHHIRIELLLLRCKTITWKAVEMTYLTEVEEALLHDFHPPYNRPWKPTTTWGRAAEILGTKHFQGHGEGAYQRFARMKDLEARQAQYCAWFFANVNK